MPVRKLEASSETGILEAAEILKDGGLVAFPTETVYGLGADAFNAKAVAKIFQAKRRPEFDPLIVHVSSMEQAAILWTEIPAEAKKLMEKFWPGPLTLVLPKKDSVPDIVTAGLSTVAVRMPRHPAALKLIEAAKTPIAAPSANLFGYTSPTTAQAVYEDLGKEIDAVLDGGRSEVGVESTVLKWEGGKFWLLRPGGVTKEAIEASFPVVSAPEKKGEKVVESPGRLESHYAPWTPFALLEKSFADSKADWDAYHRRFEKAGAAWPRIGFLGFGPVEDSALFQTSASLSERRDLAECAANLFEAMRKFDKMHLDLIVAEPVPAEGLGLAIMDRLRRAAEGRLGISHHFEKKLAGLPHGDERE